MSSQPIEGFILQSIKFQDYDQIATVFTPNYGIIKVMIKGAFRPKNNKKSLTATLAHIEMICRQGRGELWNCYEVSTLNFHFKLRERIESLEAALDMAQALLSSQASSKAALELYQLFKFYLEKLPICPYPLTFSSSFRLKILRYEGLFNIQPFCANCQERLEDYHLFSGESFCHKHAPHYSLVITQAIVDLFNHLAFGLSFSELSQLKIDSKTLQQVRLIFTQGLNLIN
jgi:DNA repair protein RecO (recombination protein O)